MIATYEQVRAGQQQRGDLRRVCDHVWWVEGVERRKRRFHPSGEPSGTLEESSRNGERALPADLQTSAWTSGRSEDAECSGPMKPRHLSNQSTLPGQVPILSSDDREEAPINESRRAEEEDFRNYSHLLNRVMKTENCEHWSCEARKYVLIYAFLLKQNLISFQYEPQKVFQWNLIEI